MKERKYSFPRFIGILVVGFLLISVPIAISRAITKSNDNYTPLQGLAYTREAYVASCTRIALSTSEVTDEIASSFCGCAYDQGTAKYGVEKFSQMDNELTTTETVTPELNEIINNCLVQIGVK